MSAHLIEGSLEVKLPKIIWTEEKFREEKRRKVKMKEEKFRESQKKEDASARNGRKVAKHCVFQ